MNQNDASVTTAGWAELDRSASEGQELVGPASLGESSTFLLRGTGSHRDGRRDTGPTREGWKVP